MKSRITILLLLILGVTSGIHAQMFTANLNGSNQTQYVATMATGMIEAELEGDMLTVSGSFENLSSAVATEIAGGAHIHLGYAGQNGAVGIVLTASLDADMLGGTFVASQNMFDLTEEQKTALMERGFYVNVHTANYQAGEIRGQLVPKSDQVFRVNLTGNNQVQPILTSASGAMIVELIGQNITISGSFSGLSSELATEIAGGGHLHMALAGQNGGVIKVLDITADADLMGGIVEAENNMFELSNDELMALNDRKIYMNIHSDNYPNGELRGQILLDSGVLFQSNLSGISQPYPVNTMASGAVVAELDGNNLIISGSFGNLSSPVATEIAGGAHIHSALAGSEGGVILVLNADLNDDEMGGVFMNSENTFELTDEQLEHLFDRGL
ncbi:MAG TPA: hypothetical protein DCE78_00780, partial [Bacteroidetes bacterium]|nr:hypothetical protein [Bacteroidota bacterium]